MVTSTRFVQLGRVVLVNYGPCAGNLAVIVEIIDHNRALIDGPTTGVSRQAINFGRVTLTPIVVSKLPRGAKTHIVKKMTEAQDVVGKWNASAWGKKQAIRARRRTLTDFERFKVMVIKKKLRSESVKTMTAIRRAGKPRTTLQKKHLAARKTSVSAKKGAAAASSSAKTTTSPSKKVAVSPKKGASPKKA